MARLTLTLLGGFSGRLDSGLPLILPTRKSQSLLAFLAVTPGTTHPRDKLAAWLWGEMPRRDGRARLRQAVFAIRRALADVSPALVLEAIRSRSTARRPRSFAGKWDSSTRRFTEEDES